MPTSSILHDIVIDNKKDAKNLIRALEKTQKSYKIVSSKEALADVTPMKQDDDVLIGKKKITVTKGGENLKQKVFCGIVI